MTTIGLIATDQLLEIVLQPRVASGDRNSVTLHVDFDSEWDGYGKSAVFFTAKNKQNVYEVVLTDGECVVPHEVLAEDGILYIGVRGVNTEDVVKTSSIIKYRIVEGAPSGDGTTVEPTADVYQQLLAAYSQANARVNELVASHNSEGEEEYRLDLYDDGTAYITIRSNGTTAVCTFSDSAIFGAGATRSYSIPERFAPPIAHYEYDGDVELCIANSFDGYTEVVLKNKNKTESKNDGVWFQFVYALGAVSVPKELVDIRVGADGTIYETAGEAVRSQFRQVSEQGSGGVKTVNGVAPDESGNVVVETASDILLASDTLTWDGDTKGRIVDDEFVHVSDAVPTLDDFANGATGETFAGTSFIVEPGRMFAYEDVYSPYLPSSDWPAVPFLVAIKDNAKLGARTFPKKGVYFLLDDDHAYRVRSLSIPGYDGFETLDPSLLPECVATKEYVDAAVGTGGGGGSSASVLYVKQNLTEEQKAQARENIGAVAAEGIEAALDRIVAIQNSLIGGGSV